ncbi:MAG: aminotransferase class V-fold PLP-dependent enzyme [Pseudonocardiaceae bacterium]|jgi:selenocysteine lyase/cysteine desulfurase|nr:aminotransferase class V-fold PLP-dependent enzyme [Pseudonocardiaceae bacterium]
MGASQAEQAPLIVLSGIRREEVASSALVGADVEVPLVSGGVRRYVNLDYAASAPCLVAVKQAVDALLPWYSSVHRGAGFKSKLATEAYEGARVAVRSFVQARSDDCVLFTRNTTDAINLLASALPTGAAVVAFASEHHANLLPWRRRNVTFLPVPHSPEEALERLDQALRWIRADARLVAVTGASNVTGEIWPYAEITRLAHRHGARVLLDAAQLAPHHPIDVTGSEIDYVAISGHKLYAPFGAGALVGRPDWLRCGEPFLAGGGAVDYVRVDDVLWAELPDRQEAGSPNVLGAVALGVACRTLQAAGMDRLATTESALLDVARAGLTAIPGAQSYQLWPIEHPRIGVLPFNLRGVSYAKLAAVLSAEYGIGVRHGCFCAHPLMTHLLGINDARARDIGENRRSGRPTAVPGAVRLSIGLGTTVEDITWLVDAVAAIANNGVAWHYQSSADGKDCWPDPDPRPRPTMPFDLSRITTA